MPTLYIKWNNNTSSFNLAGEQTTIGRGNDNNLQLRDIKISRHHCQITKTADGYKITDLGSSNATLVNNQRIKEIVLNNKDVVKLGDAELTFLSADQVADLPVPEIPPAAVQSLSVPAVEETERVSPINISAETFGEKTVPIPRVTLPPEYAPPVIDRPVSPAKNDTISKKITVVPPKTGSRLPNGHKPSRLDQITSRKTNEKKKESVLKNKPAGDKTPGYLQSSNANGKKNRTFLLVGGAALGLILVAVIIFLGSGASGSASERIKEEKKMLDEAREFGQNKDWETAKSRYEFFIKKYPASKEIKQIRLLLTQAERKIKMEKEAAIASQSLLQKKETYDIKQYPDLLKEFEQFINKYGDTVASANIRGEMDSVKRIIASDQQTDLSDLFSRTRVAIESDIQKEEYQSALDKWDEFQKKHQNNLDSILKNQIRQEVSRIKKLMEKK